jgi:hypothetical protein
MKYLEDLYMEKLLNTPSFEDRLQEFTSRIVLLKMGIGSLRKDIHNKNLKIIEEYLSKALELLNFSLVSPDRDFDQLSKKEKFIQIQKLFSSCHLTLFQLDNLNQEDQKMAPEILNRLKNCVDVTFAQFSRIYERNS